MQYHCCDLCDEMIKGEVYVFVIQKYQLNPAPDQTPAVMTVEEALGFANRSAQEQRKNQEYYEVCTECKVLFKDLIGKRKEALAKIRQEIDGIVKSKRKIKKPRSKKNV